MSEHRNELSAGHRTFGDKENMCMGVQSNKFHKNKIDNKKRGLSLNNVEYRAARTITTAPKSPIAKGFHNFHIYCDEETTRSRSRVKKKICRKGIERRRTGEESQRNSILIIAASRRARSSSNCRDRIILNQNNAVQRNLPQRSASETRGIPSRNSITRSFSTLSTNVPLSKTKHLSDEVKQRTLSSILLWKEKMRKSCTGTIPKNFAAIHPNNLNVDKMRIKSKLQKNSNTDVKILPRESSDSQYEVAQNRMIDQDKNISMMVHKVKSKLTFEHSPSKANINASTGFASENIRDNNQLNIPIKVGSSNKTLVRDSPMPLIPLKECCEKWELTHVLSAIKECDLDKIPYECDYLEDLPDTERKREENAPRLSSRFLQENVNAKQRRLIVGYLLRVGLHCHYSSHIIYQSVKLFDVAIDRIWVETDNIQLMALTCLWIILKREGNGDNTPSATTMVKLAKDMYLGQEKGLLIYEKKILGAVKFNIQFADPFSLLLYYILSAHKELKINSSDIKHIYFCGSYLIDVSMLEESLCDISVCVLAIAATELSLYFIYPYAVSMDGIGHGSCNFWKHRLSLEEWEERTMKSTKQIMIRQVLEWDKFGSNIVYKKYLGNKHGKVSDFLLNKVKRINF